MTQLCGAVRAAKKPPCVEQYDRRMLLCLTFFHFVGEHSRLHAREHVGRERGERLRGH